VMAGMHNRQEDRATSVRNSHRQLSRSMKFATDGDLAGLVGDVFLAIQMKKLGRETMVGQRFLDRIFR